MFAPEKRTSNSGDLSKKQPGIRKSDKLQKTGGALGDDSVMAR